MKAIKFLYLAVILSWFTSCNIIVDDFDDVNYVSLETVLTSHDLWYIDYNRTTGVGDVPFLSKAFTVSFVNGRLYANNNLVGAGYVGNGYGIQIGYYDTYSSGLLKIDHILDGYYNLDVYLVSDHTIKIVDPFEGVTYYLEGYQKYNFDYQALLYNNLEYFLQEYDVWEKTYTSIEGEVNEFDYENFLSFTPENIRTFYSSQDNIGTTIDNLLWDYEGEYFVSNIVGNNYIKVLTLDYDFWGNEEFELSVINDETIRLYHYNSGTTYEFKGRGYIQYMRPELNENSKESYKERKREKIIREDNLKRS